MDNFVSQAIKKEKIKLDILSSIAEWMEEKKQSLLTDYGPTEEQTHSWKYLYDVNGKAIKDADGNRVKEYLYNEDGTPQMEYVWNTIHKTLDEISEESKIEYKLYEEILNDLWNISRKEGKK